MSFRDAFILLQQRRRWTAIAALALLALTACGTRPTVPNRPFTGTGNADFGRVRPSLVFDGTHDWMGDDVSRRSTNAVWRHQLTDEERRLRDTAYPLIEPPYDRQQWYSAMAENGFWSRSFPYPDRAAYASRLFQTAYRSQTARYAKIIEDIRNDVNRLDPYFATARYVAEMDRKREASLAHVSHLTPEERANTVDRMRENAGIMRWVQAALHERVAAYQIALERMVIAAPAPMAVEAERSLSHLRERISFYGA